MAYTTPRTWADGELVTASIMNTHVRDNLSALKSPPTSLYNVNEGANYTTTSTSFVDVDATDLSHTITTTGGRVLITFFCNHAVSGALHVYFDVLVDGVRLAGDDGLIADYSERVVASAPGRSTGFTVWTSELAAGSHTFKLQWRVDAGTVTMFAGAGTSAADLHPQFAVREVS